VSGLLPRILLIVDRPGWAIDRKAKNLQRTLAGRFDLVLRYQHEVNEADLEAADIVLVFYWLELMKMEALPEAVLARHSERLVMGICSHFELEADRRDPGLAALRRLPRAVFVHNRLLEREYAPLLDVPVHYTPNGVDTSFFRPRPGPRLRAPGTLRVGWAGSIQNQGPAQRRLEEIIEPAVAAVPGVELSTAVREQRWRNAEEMLEFYLDLDVYVCASRNEGTPNPCLEAAACGIPVVTTPVGNMPELIRNGENGYFFDGTVQGLVEKLVLLRDSPSLAPRLGERMRESIAEWDWSIQAQHYARMFDEALARVRLERGVPG
jgi:glycosyltransferase involved in cell wall biosynthesis